MNKTQDNSEEINVFIEELVGKIEDNLIKYEDAPQLFSDDDSYFINEWKKMGLTPEAVLHSVSDILDSTKCLNALRKLADLPGGSDHDATASKIIYEALAELKDDEATRQRLWVLLSHHPMALRYTRRRWPGNHELIINNFEALAKRIKNSFEKQTKKYKRHLEEKGKEGGGVEAYKKLQKIVEDIRESEAPKDPWNVLEERLAELPKTQKERICKFITAPMVQGIKDRYFANPGGAQQIRNSISRLFWIGRQASKVSGMNLEEALEVMCHQQEVLVELMDRPNVFGPPSVLSAIVRALKQSKEGDGFLFTTFPRKAQWYKEAKEEIGLENNVWRNLRQRLDIASGSRIIALMSDADLDKLIEKLIEDIRKDVERFKAKANT